MHIGNAVGILVADPPAHLADRKFLVPIALLEVVHHFRAVDQVALIQILQRRPESDDLLQLQLVQWTLKQQGNWGAERNAMNVGYNPRDAHDCES